MQNRWFIDVIKSGVVLQFNSRKGTSKLDLLIKYYLILRCFFEMKCFVNLWFSKNAIKVL